MAREDVSQTSAWRPTDDEATAGSASSGGGESPASVASRSDDDPFEARPELFAIGAFAGGFVLAKVLGRLGG